MLPTKSDTGEGEESVPMHVCVVAWVDTTHCITNAALLHSTAGVDTPHFELIALLDAPRWVQRNFALRCLPQKLLLLTDSACVYISRRVSGPASSYPEILGDLVTTFENLHSYLTYSLRFLGYLPTRALKAMSGLIARHGVWLGNKLR